MWDRYIAVDWGTTNRRAYLVAAGGVLVDEFEDAMGVLGVPAGGFEAEVEAVRARLGDCPMLLGGMIGSNRGWREAPYVPLPAGLGDVARAILWAEPGRTGIVPGLFVQRLDGPDVMRGEEVQVLGAVAAGLLPGDGLVCHPGTHAKWITLQEAHVTSFRTMMTGEIFALLKAHSILAAQMEAEVDAEGFARGVTAALRGADLMSALFSARARAALGSRDSESGYVSGLLIGSDVRAALAEAGQARIALVGRPELCDLYAAALAQAGREAPSVDGSTAFLAGIRALVETFR